MDYEQKYKDTLERVKELLNSAKNQGHIIVRVEDIENAFPELEESEYERIRKDIIAFLRSKNGYMTPYENWEFHNKWLSWLEKQGKQEFINVEQKLYREDIEDGIYLCYKDGYKQLFSPITLDTMKHDQVTHIGIKIGEHRIGLKLNSLGEQSLPYNIHLGSDDFDYKKEELHALDDFNGKANTDHLKRNGKFEFNLNDNEWIPSLGELAIIFKNKDKLNEALTFIGAEELMDNWYWSSTEYSSNIAWYVFFSNGSVLNTDKPTSYVIRPVCAF